jgi:hypothetical protein
MAQDVEAFEDMHNPAFVTVRRAFACILLDSDLFPVYEAP